MNVLITGATRGIGFETAQALAEGGHAVLLTGRHGDDAEAAAARIREATGGDVTPRTLDVADAGSCEHLVEALTAESVQVDGLINNAGIFPDLGAGFFEVDEDTIRMELEIHFFGAWRLTRDLLPGMLERGFGRIVNLTSGYGCSNMDGGMTAYRVAKAAANALTRIAAAEAQGDVLVNAVDPGWVSTDMGGDQAPRTPAEAAADVVHALELPAGGPNGVRLLRREPAGW